MHAVPSLGYPGERAMPLVIWKMKHVSYTWDQSDSLPNPSSARVFPLLSEWQQVKETHVLQREQGYKLTPILHKSKLNKVQVTIWASSIAPTLHFWTKSSFCYFSIAFSSAKKVFPHIYPTTAVKRGTVVCVVWSLMPSEGTSNFVPGFLKAFPLPPPYLLMAEDSGYQLWIEKA